MLKEIHFHCSQFTFNCFSPSVPHLVAEQSTVCSAPRQICRAIRKINQHHIHYTKKLWADLFHYWFSFIFRFCLAFSPSTLYILSKLILQLIHFGSLSKGPQLCYTSGSSLKGTSILVLGPHLFAISSAVVCEVL